MNAVTKKPTDSEIDIIISECDRLSTELLNGRIGPKEALTYAIHALDVLGFQYQPSDKTPQRFAALKAAEGLKTAAANEIPAMFQPGSELAGEGARKYMHARNFVRSMKFNMDDEEKGRDLINGLYLDLKTGVRIIDKDHEKMKEVWDLYYSRKLSGAYNYAFGNQRTESRDKKVIKSLLGNRDKYNQELLATVLSKLGHVEE